MVTSINSSTASNVAGTGQTTGVDPANAGTVSAGVSGSAAFLSAILAYGTAPSVEAGSSGLRSPVNPENADALLLLVESQFDQSTAVTRGAALASRFGAAQNAIADSSAALQAAAGDLTAAVKVLNDAQAKLDADTANDGAQLVIDADNKAVTAAQTQFETAQTALEALQPKSISSAVGLIAREVQADVAQDDSHADVRSAYRDVAYQNVAETDKHYRDGDVERGRSENARRAQDGTMRDENRGVQLASALAAGAADAIATIQALRAAMPPAVSKTAAAESGGRVRLSL